MGRRARDDDIVPATHIKGPEDRLDLGTAALDIDALVTDRIAIERTWRVGPDIRDPDIPIAEDQPATGDGIGTTMSSGKRSCSFRCRGLRRIVGGEPLVGHLPDPRVGDLTQDPPVIEQRGVGGKTLPHQFLVVEIAGRIAMLGMPLGRDRALARVVRHLNFTSS